MTKRREKRRKKGGKRRKKREERGPKCQKNSRFTRRQLIGHSSAAGLRAAQTPRRLLVHASHGGSAPAVVLSWLCHCINSYVFIAHFRLSYLHMSALIAQLSSARCTRYLPPTEIRKQGCFVSPNNITMASSQM